MKTARFLMLLAVALLAGCGPTSKIAAPQSGARSYNGTASVGDFLTISIDSNAQTITYKNYTNGEAGTVPYTVNSDGTCSASLTLSNGAAPDFACALNTVGTGGGASGLQLLLSNPLPRGQDNSANWIVSGSAVTEGTP